VAQGEGTFLTGGKKERGSYLKILGVSKNWYILHLSRRPSKGCTEQDVILAHKRGMKKSRGGV